MKIENLGRASISWLRPRRLFVKQTQVLVDVLLLAAAFEISYELRFDFDIPAGDLRRLPVQILIVVLIQFAALWVTGVYAFIWRYIGLAESKTFLRAAFLSCAVALLVRLWVPVGFEVAQVPRSIILIDTVLAFGGLLGVRVVRRILYEWSEKQKKLNNGSNGRGKPVLLIGAGRAGVLAAKEIQGRGDTGLNIRGFIDDDSNKQGSVIQGIRVMGTTQDLARLVHELHIDHVVISIAQASRREFRRILDICERVPVRVRVIPGLYEILQGRVQVSRIRDLQIEDLLGREPVQLEEEEIGRFLAGRTVMVTGAGGSIGSELARQVARFNPSRLLLVERAEFALFDIDRELRANLPDLFAIPLVSDVNDRSRMETIFRTYRPQVVLHAAAHKHVPMMECNASEAIKNNILATHLLGELSGEFGVEVFVLISTDKAVRPTSIMGASKRVAELVMQDLDRRFPTRYVAVRFGNVIGSAGSVIPIFREQIRNGGPVTVTHPEMTRYFMTIPEAAQLVLQAGAMGDGGEIFILDMGEPVRILDLAKEAITLSGLKPFEEIEVMFTGIRPGEKLSEELVITEEAMSKTRHPKIFIGKLAGFPREKVRPALKQLLFLVEHGDDQQIREFFSQFLPEAKLNGNGSTPEKAHTFPLSHGSAAGAFLSSSS